MAALRGTLTGNRGEVSRLGSKNSGIRSTLNTWNGEVETILEADGKVEIWIKPYEGTHKRMFVANVNTGFIEGLQ